MKLRTLGIVLAATAALGCSEDADEASSGAGNPVAAGSTAAGSTTGGEGGSSGSGFGSGGAMGSGGAPACAQSTAEATLTKSPVDIVLVIDNSGSMSEEISAVQEEINVNFAQILEDSAVDYRLVMLTDFGPLGEQSVCIGAPLSNIDCANLPLEPTDNAPKFFHHDPGGGSEANTGISSNNALCQLNYQLTSSDFFGLHPMGYKALLRTEANKAVVIITDDNSNNNNKKGCVGEGYPDSDTVDGGIAAAAAFDAAFTAAAPEHFGTPAARRYTFHAIVGMAAKDSNDASKSHLPTDPILTQKCGGDAVSPGTGYQALAVLTGGLRHHSCASNSVTDFSGVFQSIADSVVAGAKVACDFAIPEPPPGETLDLATVQVKYSSMGNPAGTFNQAADLAACDAQSFYVEGDRIVLCPAVCELVQADPDAKIDIAYGCELTVQ
jgi:hypothetical protein